jgi:MFS family permease
MFVLVYMGASPFKRREWGIAGPAVTLVGSALLLWSIATIATGFANSYHHLLLGRSFIGIGEAASARLSPRFISDPVPPGSGAAHASRSIFVAIPVGSALGYILGARVGAHTGWRTACFWPALRGSLLGCSRSSWWSRRAGVATAWSRVEHKF